MIRKPCCSFHPLLPWNHVILQAANAIKAAKENGVRRIVFVSLTSAIPESEFHVAPYLLYTESKIRQSGMEWTMLRNSLYLDAMVGWVERFGEEGFIPYPVGDNRISFVCRDDLARATAGACLDHAHAGKIYSLTGPEALHMKELAEIVSRLSGKPVSYNYPTEADYAAFCAKDNLSPYMVEILQSIYRAAREGRLCRSYGSRSSIGGGTFRERKKAIFSVCWEKNNLQNGFFVLQNGAGTDDLMLEACAGMLSACNTSPHTSICLHICLLAIR